MIDERDQAALDDREADQEDASDAIMGGPIQHVKVTSRVCWSSPRVMRLVSNLAANFVGQVTDGRQLPGRGRKGRQILSALEDAFGWLTMTKIVILSLVRNSGGGDDDREMQTISQHTRASIGFLKVRADTHSVNGSAD